jgi:hypothetical protein
LLSNDRESNETTAIARQELRKYVTVLEPLLGSGPRATVEVLPLFHKICFAKPVLTDDLCIVRKQTFSVRYDIRRKAKHIRKRQPHHLFTKDVTITAWVQLKKKSLAVGLKGLDNKTN